MATISTMTWQILGKRTILLFSIALGLAACGQKGALFIPTDPEARERAIFPQVLLPDTRPDTPATTPSQP
jgi:predicted small lipoprotein YifL